MHIMDEVEKEALADTPKESPKTSIVAATTTNTSEPSKVVPKVTTPPPHPSPRVNGVVEVKDEPVESAIKQEQVDEDPSSLIGPDISIVPSSTSDKIQIKEEKEPVLVESSQEPEPHDLTVTCTSSYEVIPKVCNEKQNTPKVISISVEQLNSKSVDGEKVKAKPVTSRKRSARSTDSDDNERNNYKKYKFPEVDRLNDEREQCVNEFIDKASSTNIEELQKNAEKLQQEIHSLSALARAKEVEWNHIIRIKKIKEEMYLRLQRRKHVMLLSLGGGNGRLPDSLDYEYTQDHFLNDEVTFNPTDGSPSKPHPKIPSTLTITRSQSSPSQNMQRFLMQQPQHSEPKNSSNNQSLMMVPIVSSTPLLISSTSKMQTARSQNLSTLKIPMLDREKIKNSSNNRNNLVPILPKPNPEHSPPIGRQGPIVDVKSIIADYRQAHPEQIPRRGRRLKGVPSQQNFPDNLVTSSRNVLSMSSIALGSGSQVRTVGSTSGDYSFLMANQDTSRPSSADSNRSSSAMQNEVNASGLSFKDVLVKFAKMSQNNQGERKSGTTSTQSKSQIYPEVTLHPVVPAGGQSPPNPSTSLLHGILTKNNASASTKSEASSSNKPTTFSPTLARLLTTPERPPTISTSITTTAMRGSNSTVSCSSTSTRPTGNAVSISDILSSSKNRNELTITPVVSQPAKVKEDANITQEDDPEDSADRLIIDESEEQENRPTAEEEEMEAENVPQCQGCNMRSAQFVCAGCSNQWYCSRACQVTAWDEHSEICSG